MRRFASVAGIQLGSVVDGGVPPLHQSRAIASDSVGDDSPPLEGCDADLPVVERLLAGYRLRSVVVHIVATQCQYELVQNPFAEPAGAQECRVVVPARDRLTGPEPSTRCAGQRRTTALLPGR